MNIEDAIGKINRRLERITAAGEITSGDLAAISRQINDEGWMQKIIDRRFYRQAERTDGSRPWLALAKSTVKERIRLGFGGTRPILRRTGALYGGAREAVARSFSFRGVKFDINKVDVDYAQYHQEGTPKMPARKFMNNPTSDELKPAMKRARELIRLRQRKKMRAAAQAE
jgi:hypothetical protein